MANYQFKEHIFPFVRSQVMAMVNHDPFFHNPHFFNSKNASLLNVPMPDPDQEIDHKFLRTPLRNERGVMRIQCDVHNNMSAYRVGFDHPYFAVTDADGKFEIREVPPGKYTVVAWHEGYKSYVRRWGGQYTTDRISANRRLRSSQKRPIKSALSSLSEKSTSIIEEVL